MSDSHETPTGEFSRPDAAAAPEPRPGVVAKVDVAARSHQGLVRPNNEDHYLVARLGRSLTVLLTNLPPGRVPDRYEEAGYALAVADGMGGAEAGEVASALALSIGAELTLGESVWHLRIDEEEAERITARVGEYFRQIHRVVSRQAHTTPGLEGMGTTLTVAYSVGLDMFVFHVGDSRAYLLREGTLRQLTRDQTVAQALADAGQIPPDAVGSHRLRHVLTHAIGADRDVSAMVYRSRLADGDRLLLCTDGLTDMVSDAEVSEALLQAPDAQGACDALIQRALDGGGRDNVTVVAAFYRVVS